MLFSQNLSLNSSIPIDSVHVEYNHHHAGIPANLHCLKRFPKSNDTENKNRYLISHPQANHKSNSRSVTALVQDTFIIRPVWL